VIDKGVIVHYTPHYIIIPSVADTICEILASENMDCGTVKLFVMLREPTSRTISSWWYKSGCYKHACHPLQAHMPDGFQRVRDLDKCMTDHGFSISEASKSYLSARSRLAKRMDASLSACPLKILQPNVSKSMYSSHFGKSLYAHQLLRWYQRFAFRSVYVMTLENFVAEPRREVDLLLRWLGLSTYGPEGFPSPEALLKATQKKYNVHDIPEDIMREQVAPLKVEITSFFQQSVRDLYALLQSGLASKKEEPQPTPGNVTWKEVSELVHKINVWMVEEEEAMRNS
jgi:hypothetical protein